MVICLERCADLHMAQLMPLPLTVSCFSKIQIDFTFLGPAHLDSPEKKAVKRACVCSVSKFTKFCGHMALPNQMRSFAAVVACIVCVVVLYCSWSIVTVHPQQHVPKFPGNVQVAAEPSMLKHATATGAALRSVFRHFSLCISLCG